MAQTMNPRPRPPSPTSRARAQKERYAEGNPTGTNATLTAKDAAILMAGLDLSPPNTPNKRNSRRSIAAGVPSAEGAFLPSPQSNFSDFKPFDNSAPTTVDDSAQELFDYVNLNLPPLHPPIYSFNDLRSGKVLTRLVEALSSRPSRISDAEFSKFRPITTSEPLDSQYLDTCFAVFDELADAAVSSKSSELR